jgi:hypothetical protein
MKTVETPLEYVSLSEPQGSVVQNFGNSAINYFILSYASKYV